MLSEAEQQERLFQLAKHTRETPTLELVDHMLGLMDGMPSCRANDSLVDMLLDTRSLIVQLAQASA